MVNGYNNGTAPTKLLSCQLNINIKFLRRMIFHDVNIKKVAECSPRAHTALIAFLYSYQSNKRRATAEPWRCCKQ